MLMQKKKKSMVTITNGIGGNSKIINWKGQVGFKFVKCYSICYVGHHKSYNERSGGCLLSGMQTQHLLVGAITGSIWPFWGCIKQNKTESLEGKKKEKHFSDSDTMEFIAKKKKRILWNFTQECIVSQPVRPHHPMTWLLFRSGHRSIPRVKP